MATTHQRPPTAKELGVSAGTSTRGMRACMICSIIRSQADFTRDGCPNCDSALGLAGNADAVQDCTSSNFNGVIALMDPDHSWVARYHRLDGYVQGIYAVQVVGNPGQDVIEAIRSAGMRYVRRDGSKDEGEEARAKDVTHAEDGGQT